MAATPSGVERTASTRRARPRTSNGRPPVFVLGCLLLSLFGCSGETPVPKPDPTTTKAPAAKHELRIAAAADLRFALDELVSAFKAGHPESEITVTPGSSGNLFAQLSNEAPFDLFLSADIEYPRKLIEQGQGVKGSEFEYATGHLVLWATNESPFDIAGRGIDVVRDEAVEKIALANPRTAPYGRAAVAALKNLGVYDAVESRLVYGENVAQTAQMVESQGADLGIIALSLALSPPLRDMGKYWPVPADSHPPIVQGGVVLRWTQDAALARAFRDFLVSVEGQAILRRFGFEPAGD
jgi:molybdate transport system substrate-binding protein